MKITEVAAAILEDGQGRVLLGCRPTGSVYAGYWEFPGGKVEAGETPRAALVRELHEELGIRVAANAVLPWLVREHVYEHAHVRLHFFRLRQWSGELQTLQHAALHWQQTAEPAAVSPMLPTNAPVLQALALPDFYAISQAATLGMPAQLEALEKALKTGLRLLQIREPALTPDQRSDFAMQATRLCQDYGARVLINSDPHLARAGRADGLHLNSRQLMQTALRPDFPLVAASCHNLEELAQAAHLQLDFVVLGPVQPSASHPGQPGMGWAYFDRLLENCSLPVYALGGLSKADLDRAQQAGAHGIAAIRAAWA